MAYFTEVDNWVGSIPFSYSWTLEVIITGWIMKEDFVEGINKGSYWKMPRWIYTIVIRFITPIAILIVLIGSTFYFIRDGYFRLIPSFVENTPSLVPMGKWC